MGKLAFHARGAIYEAAASVALRAGLKDDAAEGLLAVMLAYVQGDDATTLAPRVLGPNEFVAAWVGDTAAAPGWPAGTPVASLGPQHGTVLVCGERVPCTWAIAYRDVAGVVRNKDTGERADWAARWWELP